jgi:hypothetical protein
VHRGQPADDRCEQDRGDAAGNVSSWHRRGSLVDEAAIDRALADRCLGGVALGVFEAPISGERSRLLRRDNVILTPHMGGATYETLRRGAEMLADEIRRFGAAEPLGNLVGAVGARGWAAAMTTTRSAGELLLAIDAGTGGRR